MTRGSGKGTVREIKFRAWDEGNKIMHYNFQFIRTGLEGNDWIVFASDEHPLDMKPHPFENPYFSQQLKVMQATGMKDRLGNEIFEGDILRDNKRVGRIFWSDDYACWALKNELTDHPSDVHTFYSIPSVVARMEIFGNIYETPDLIRS